MYFPSFSLENKLFAIHQTSFSPVEELEFSELKTPLVYTFSPPIIENNLCNAIRDLKAKNGAVRAGI